MLLHTLKDTPIRWLSSLEFCSKKQSSKSHISETRLHRAYKRTKNLNAMPESLQEFCPDGIVNSFIFKSIVRMSIISREIQKIRSSPINREDMYKEVCTAILKHADDTRVILYAIDNLAIDQREKEFLKSSVKMINLDSIIYNIGHTLIEMKGLLSVSNINTCFVRKTKKFWVDLDNIETIFGMIIPYLPVYVFGDDGSGKISSFISSVYFDTDCFHLYSRRIRRDQNAKSLRIRSYGESSIISYVELKTHEDGWTGEKSTKKRFLVHTKLIPLLSAGEDIWEEIKSINSDEAAYQLYQEVIALIRSLSLKPVVKTVYSRTAFQFPSDSSIRISIDTKLSMWNGDSGKLFPYAILEIKLEEGNEKEWVLDLMNSSLLIPVDKFSKYLHGCSIHYDTVPSIPYWYNQITNPIKKDISLIHKDTSIENLSQIGNDVNYLLESIKNQRNPPDPPLYKPLSTASCAEAQANHHIVEFTDKNIPSTSYTDSKVHRSNKEPLQNKHTSKIQNMNTNTETNMQTVENTTQKDFFKPTALNQPSSPAVPNTVSNKPVTVPVRVEPKVFFANERTFLSWLHFAIFIGGIGAALMGLGDVQAALSGVCFVAVSVIFSIYALYLYIWRSRKIKEKNPGPYDDLHGPVILVAVFLSAMITSVFFKFPLK